MADLRSGDFIRFDLAPESGRRGTFFSRRRRNPPQHLRSLTFCEASESQTQTNRTSKPQITRVRAKTHKQQCTYVRTHAHPRTQCRVVCSLIDQKAVAAVAFGLLLLQPPRCLSAAPSVSTLLALFPAGRLHTNNNNNWGTFVF